MKYFLAAIIFSFTSLLNLVSAQDQNNSAELFNKFCSSCHGYQLQQFKMLKTWDKDSEYLEEIIKEGDSNKGMPSFSALLDEESVDGLIKYIQDFDYNQNHIVEVSSTENYKSEVVVGGLEIPWGMEFLPNGDLLITEKEGKLSLFNKKNGLTEIKGLPKVRNKGQGGLLDIKLHPNYIENLWIYISYSYIDDKDDSKGNTAVIRARLKNNTLVDIEELFKGTPTVTTNHHFGSRIAFDNENFLYFSIGDRGKRDEFPQKLDNSNGKIHRLHDDGRVPADNPFVNNKNAQTSIYSYGHRNPQGMIFNPLTKEIWVHEHGPKGGDEINIIKKGANYGWPVISYGINYSGTKFTDLTEKEGMEQPMYYYVPSIAPCGMEFLDSNLYPDWKNNILIGSLKFQYLERLELFNNKVVYQERLLHEYKSRVRNVKQGPDGYIYIALEGPGRIIRLLPLKN